MPNVKLKGKPAYLPVTYMPPSRGAFVNIPVQNMLPPTTTDKKINEKKNYREHAAREEEK